MDKFTRQLNLVALLQQAGVALTFADIRSRLPQGAYPQGDAESARRSFERDKADLQAMGVPLEVLQPPDDPSGTAYTVDSPRRSGSSVSDPGFTPGELAALRFAATAVALRSESIDHVTEATDGLRKYGGMGTPAAERTVADLQVNDNLATLFAAVLDSAPVGFTYSGRTRRVLPVQLANRGGHWYLRCQDLDAQESRTYRLDRFVGAVLALPPEEAAERVVGAADVRPDGTSGATRSLGTLRIRPWEFGAGEPARAVVALDPPAGAVATAGDPDLEVLEQNPHGITVALSVRNPEGLWQWLSSFLGRAELLEPPDLREAYRSHLRSIVDEPAAESGAR